MKSIWKHRYTVVSTLVLAGMVTLTMACAKKTATVPFIPTTPTGGTGGFNTGSFGGAGCPSIQGAQSFHPRDGRPYYATLTGQAGLNTMDVRLSFLYPRDAEESVSQFVGSVGFGVPGSNAPACASTVRPNSGSPMPGTFYAGYNQINGLFWGRIQVPYSSPYGGGNPYMQTQQMLGVAEATVQIGANCPAVLYQGQIFCGGQCNCVDLWVGDAYFPYTITSQQGTGGSGNQGWGWQ
jgi:hypothetical protein